MTYDWDYNWKQVASDLGISVEQFQRSIERMNKALEDMLNQSLFGVPHMAAIPHVTEDMSKTAQTVKTLIFQAVAKKYGGIMPVRIDMVASPIMAGWYLFNISIPGQTRTVTVTGKQMQSMKVYTTSSMEAIERACFAREEVIDDVLYAIYCLLEEDTEDD